jgi:hypothetical protein
MPNFRLDLAQSEIPNIKDCVFSQVVVRCNIAPAVLYLDLENATLFPYPKSCRDLEQIRGPDPPFRIL